jgi:hypothetical protein
MKGGELEVSGGPPERSGANLKLPAGRRKLRDAGFSIQPSPEVSGAEPEASASRRNLQSGGFTLRGIAGTSGAFAEVPATCRKVPAAGFSIRGALEASGGPPERSGDWLLDPARRRKLRRGAGRFRRRGP